MYLSLPTFGYMSIHPPQFTFKPIGFYLSFVQVCERHFKEEYLRTTTKYTDRDSRTIEVTMNLTRLMHDALPTIFQDSPGYLSDTHHSTEEPEMKKKRREDKQLQKALEESALAHEKELHENKLTCLDDIVSRLHLLQSKKYWSPVNSDNHVIFAHIIAAMDAPKLLSSVIISSDMSVHVFGRCAPYFR